MPVVSPSRFRSASSSSYGSALGAPSPYGSTAGSYVPRSAGTRAGAFSERTTEYRSYRFSCETESYSSGGDSAYSAARFGRAPSASDSDSGISGVSGVSAASRIASSRSSPGRRSREASATRSDSGRAREYLGATTAEFYNKYSPANYVPLSQRIARNGDVHLSKASSLEASRPPQPPRTRRSLRPLDAEVKPAAGLRSRASTNPADDPPSAAAAAADGRPRPKREPGAPRPRAAPGRLPRRSPSRLRPESDDNGNDLPSEVRRKFDPKMTVTRLPARDPALFPSDGEPVPVHRYASAGSLRREFLSSSAPAGDSSDSGRSPRGDERTPPDGETGATAAREPRVVEVRVEIEGEPRLRGEIAPRRVSDFASRVRVSPPPEAPPERPRRNPGREEPAADEPAPDALPEAAADRDPDEERSRSEDERPGISTIRTIDDTSDEDDAGSTGAVPDADPETPVAKRKHADANGESPPSPSSSSSSSRIHRTRPKDSLYAGKSSPSNSLAPSDGSLLNNSNSGAPCGTLTTGRRRSVDSKSPQPGGEIISKTSGLNGLRNIGNTCFMNSVVQCLSNTKLLLEYCGSAEAFTPDINTTLSCMKGALIKAFSTVITELWKADETDGVVNTTSLKAQIQRFAPRFMGYSQQDAQEFLRYLLEGLHEDVNRVTVKPKPILTEIDDNLSDAQKAQESWQRYLRSEDSRVGDIFVGQLKSSLRCTHCSHTSVTFDPFWDLSLPIPSRTGQLKLTQCLSHFTREEELDGDEKPTCSKCQVRRKCLKWFTVQKFPKVLVIHLKRFSPTERFRGKLNVSVDFPLSGLDMTPYAATISDSAGPPPPAAVYNLYAVSNHSGTTYSGHYTAYCKHPYNGEWHEYNDSRVSPISPKNVVTSEAYVLFYELVSGSAAS